MDHLRARSAIVTVGLGRGFVVRDERDPLMPRLVITAAHCLPFFPPCASASSTQERTYDGLLGRLGDKPTVWAECLFADPIGDIAVLGPPDNQDCSEQAKQYNELMKVAAPLPTADAASSCRAWLPSLKGEWFQWYAEHSGGPLRLVDADDSTIAPGMSGSRWLRDRRRCGRCGWASPTPCLPSADMADATAERLKIIMQTLETHASGPQEPRLAERAARHTPKGANPFQGREELTLNGGADPGLPLPAPASRLKPQANTRPGRPAPAIGRER
jgi:hypothetical protein